MRRHKNATRFASLVFLVAGCALLMWGRPAAANEVYQQQTGLPCSSCHMPNQELRGRDGLNPFGMAFLNCGHKLGCSSSVAVHTTERFLGVATLRNTCKNGEQIFIVVREGKNKAKRDVPLILDQGNKVQIGLGRGSTFAYQCGSMPTDRSQYHWITLDKWTND
jgi:hypothetical protein